MSAPALAWPDLRLRAVSACTELLFEAAFSGLRAVTFVALMALRWSPGAIGAGVGMSVGLLLPQISGVEEVNLTWSVVLAGVGLYLGKAYPEPVLRTVVTVGGTIAGIAVGASVAGNMSVPLFAVPGMIIGGGVGATWAALASRLDVVTATGEAAWAMKIGVTATRWVIAELVSFGNWFRGKVRSTVGASTARPVSRKFDRDATRPALVPVGDTSTTLGEFMIRTSERYAARAVADKASAMGLRTVRLPDSERRRRRRVRRRRRLGDS